ncbi:MAG: polyprenol monophosphomannose synthase [Planctomycetaceae bacterium]|nr:polyprenol monophosphomannose synthase [Planctomycetaceae bacterium]
MNEPPLQTSRVAITICTYNEHENLEKLMTKLRQIVPQATLVVVDDNSPDGTSDLAEEWAARDSHVLAFRRLNERGLGTATLFAFQRVLEADFDILVNLDADFSHDPHQIPRLLEQLEQDRADVAICSRYVKEGRIEGWPVKRHLMSKAINTWARFWMKLNIRDCSGSFRAYRCEILKRINFADFRADGYAVQEELLYRCANVGARFVEIPFTFVDRVVGASKINWREAVKAVVVIAQCGMEKTPGVQTHE